MPVFNGEKYLIDAIQSVIHQTFSDWELIIIDDGSKDNSLKISKECEAIDQRIIVLQHTGGINKGVSASRNLGMKYAKGKWISLLDADDIWKPAKLREEFKIQFSNDDLILIYSKALTFDYDESENFNSLVYGSGESGKTTDPFKKLISGFLAPTSGISFRNDIAQKVGGFNEQLDFAEDTLFMHQLIEYGNIYFIDEVLSYFRVHTDSSASLTDPKKKLIARYTIYCILLITVKKYNRKTVSGALIKTGFRKILRSYVLFPNNDLPLVKSCLLEILRNPNIFTIDKVAALILFFTEFLLVPLKYLNSKA